MKNIFKFMGIALMACSLTVACGSDENDDNNNEEPQNTASFVVTLDNENMQVTEFLAVDHTAEGYLTVYGYESADQNSRFVQGFLESTVVSDATYESTSGDIMQFKDPANTYYDADGILSQEGQPGTYYNHYTKPATFIENVTAVDLNALTMSANWTAKIVMLSDAVAAGSFDAAPEHDFSGNINNMTWAWAQ